MAIKMLSALAGAALMVSGVGASAQAAASGEQAIEECRESAGEDHLARIACLEAALLNETPPRVAEAPAAPSAPADVDAGAGTLRSEDDFGREQLAEGREETRKKIKERLTAKVIEAAYTPRGALIVILDNGQIWRQSSSASGGRVKLSAKRDYTAEIKKGSISGYRMTIVEKGASFAATRLK